MEKELDTYKKIRETGQRNKRYIKSGCIPSKSTFKYPGEKI